MSMLIARAETLARDRHKDQKRKGAGQLPYITHVEEVATLTERFGGSEVAIAAAWLHDVVEDCPPTSLADIEAGFGGAVAGLVAELTDDKSLPKAERKRLQVVHAAGKSPEAALIKIADKSSNVRSIADAPPDWPHERMLAYLEWAETVVSALPPRQPEVALKEFQRQSERARLALNT
jgi:(p)ppGpp synthase/HD superfamily hydrolase